MAILCLMNNNYYKNCLPITVMSKNNNYNNNNNFKIFLKSKKKRYKAYNNRLTSKVICN